jgi:hypothetical protein
MLVYDNWQVQGPNGIGDGAGKVVLEAMMSIIQQSSMEGYLIKCNCLLCSTHKPTLNSTDGSISWIAW